MADNMPDDASGWKKQWRAYLSVKSSYYNSLSISYQAKKRYQQGDAEGCVLAIKNFELAFIHLRECESAVTSYIQISTEQIPTIKKHHLTWLSEFISEGTRAAKSDNDKVYFMSIPETGDTLGEGKTTLEGKEIEWKYPDIDQRWTEQAKEAFDPTIQ